MKPRRDARVTGSFRQRESVRVIGRWSAWRAGVVALALVLLSGGGARAIAQGNDDCLSCHNDKGLTKKRDGRTVSLFVDEVKFKGSVHGKVNCTDCHADLKGKDLPHDETLKPAQCRSCHANEQTQHDQSLHGRALARGDPLAPKCSSCHGNHDIVARSNPRSPVQPARIPYLCGRCHSEGGRVQKERTIHQSNIISNYTESIHGEALMTKGLTVAATCVSCHTAHSIRKHTDPKSSIARANIAATCSACHAAIENVHRKIIEGLAQQGFVRMRVNGEILPVDADVKLADAETAPIHEGR